MKNQDSRRINTVVRASEFAKKYQLDRPPYGVVVKRLHAAALRLPELTTEQSSAHSSWQSHSIVLDDLREELRHGHLIKVSAVGRRILKGKPGAVTALKVPGKRASNTSIAASGKAMAEFIKDDVPLFLEEGMPRDFLVRLRAATRKFVECRRAIDQCLDRQKKATAALAREIPPARNDVYILKALLRERLLERDGAASDWASAMRVGRRMGPPRHGKWKWPSS